jgi:eukaryotic-like serine/threonine-protein kinase
VYGTDGAVQAVPFDLRTREVRGGPRSVAVQAMMTDVGAVNVAVAAAAGTLAYVRGSGGVRGLLDRQLVWVDRAGRETVISVPSRGYATPSISPDGRRAAIYAADGQHDLWMLDIATDALTRATFDPGADMNPVWSADGARLFFTSGRNLFTQAADGTGTAERLIESTQSQLPTAVSPDGQRLLFTENNGDVFALALDASRTVTPVLRTAASERNAVISPNGQWLAYESSESGANEIYVRPWPNVDRGRWQVSTNGGTRPLWSRGGAELFYLGFPRGSVMRVAVIPGTTWKPSSPVTLFDQGYYTSANAPGRTYDITPDGRRFLMIKFANRPDDAQSSPIVVVEHWAEEVKRLVAGDQ